MRYNGVPGSWTQIGGAAQWIYAGGYGLAATRYGVVGNGDIYRYLGTPWRWERAGGPGAGFAMTNSALYGVTTDQQAVMRYNGVPDSWTQIGGPANWQLFAGGYGLVARDPIANYAYRYLGTPWQWERMLGSTSYGRFVVTANAIYYVTNFGISRYLGQPEKWEKIGGPTADPRYGSYQVACP